MSKETVKSITYGKHFLKYVWRNLMAQFWNLSYAMTIFSFLDLTMKILFFSITLFGWIQNLTFYSFTHSDILPGTLKHFVLLFFQDNFPLKSIKQFCLCTQNNYPPVKKIENSTSIIITICYLTSNKWKMLLFPTISKLQKRTFE